MKVEIKNFIDEPLKMSEITQEGFYIFVGQEDVIYIIPSKNLYKTFSKGGYSSDVFETYRVNDGSIVTPFRGEIKITI